MKNRPQLPSLHESFNNYSLLIDTVNSKQFSVQTETG